MLFLAASLLGIVIGATQQQAVLRNPAWAKVEPNLVRIDSVGQSPGLAVLIDPNGYFLAHRNAVVSQPAVGRTSSGEVVLLTIVSSDDQTQLILLHAENWIAKGRTGVKVADKVPAGSQVFAATPAGPIMGELVSDQRVGQMRPSLRYAPLCEVRLESNIAPVAGALVFDTNGGLTGVLGATLTPNNDQLAYAKRQAEGDPSASRGSSGIGRLGGGGGGVAPGKASSGANDVTKNVKGSLPYGPQGMTVAYSLSPVVIQHAVEGFLSDDHKVEHPSIGIFFKSSASPGALIEEVLNGSPAAEAGIKVGDLVTAVDGEPIKGPVDLAIALFKHKVGDQVKVQVHREDKDIAFDVKVRSQSETFWTSLTCHRMVDWPL